VPLTPVLFSGEIFGGVVAGTKYYINRAVNATQFTITDTIIQTTATATTAVSNLITVLSTAGFTANSPIKFIGNTFGGLINNTIYYIQVVNDATSFTVSTSPGGSALTLSSAAGEMEVQTVDETFVLSTASGSMTASSTNTKETISYGQGSMNATFKTKLFGDVVKGTTYFISEITNDTTFKISETEGGSAFTLKTLASPSTSFDSFSTRGPRILQGPHHGAHTSTRIGRLSLPIVLKISELVTSIAIIYTLLIKKKKVSINGIIYESISSAVIGSGIDRQVMRYRLKSKNYPEYFYI
jgi:hypothetical protein